MTVLAGRKADIYLTSGVPTVFTNEATSGNLARQVYSITDPVKRYWDTGTAISVEEDDGGGWGPVDPDDYSVQYVGGRIVFAVARPLGASIRVDGAYLTYSQLGEAHEWAIDPQGDLLDSTVFGATWRRYTPVLLGADATVGRWWLDEFFLDNLGDQLVLVFFADASAQPAGPRYEAYAHIKQDSIKSAVDALVEEELSFTIDGSLYYVAN